MESTGTSPQGQPLDSGLSAGGGEVSGFPGGTPVLTPWWVRTLPFFLSAVFFLSAFFAIFSPLPLLFLRFRVGRSWTWAALATNSVIVGVAAGRMSLAIYAVFVAALTLVMGELVHRRKSVEKTAAVTLLAMLMSGAVLVSWYAHLHQLNPIQELKQEISVVVDTLEKSMSQNAAENPPEAPDMAEWKQSLLVEFPSVIAVFALIMVWANLTTLIRFNPAGVREKLGLDGTFLRKWKAPEFLIWPTIVAGFLLVLDVGLASNIALNAFRFFMAIYAIQGLSILSFFFDVWNVRGFFRTLGFLVAVFLMMPLLLSLGFFDLWFDFRGKFRQS